VDGSTKQRLIPKPGEKGEKSPFFIIMPKYFCTHSGTPIYPSNMVNMNDLNIDDIAHALSMICRFNGHISQFYSVAQHSVHVADIVATMTDDPKIIFQGLMHDAGEAYVGDVISPIKKLAPDIGKLENEFMFAIASKFGFAPTKHELVHQADLIALAYEATHFTKIPSQWIHDLAQEYPQNYQRPQCQSIAKREFLIKFEELSHAANNQNSSDD
jgi:hypothetical protein